MKQKKHRKKGRFELSRAISSARDGARVCGSLCRAELVSPPPGPPPGTMKPVRLRTRFADGKDTLLLDGLLGALRQLQSMPYPTGVNRSKARKACSSSAGCHGQ